MSQYKDLPEDIYGLILSEYKFCPYISKSINKICNQSNIYNTCKKRYVSLKIIEFIENNKLYQSLNKELNNYNELSHFGLKNIPKDKITKQMCINAINFNPYEIILVPLSLLDYELIYIAITKVPSLIKNNIINMFIEDKDYRKKLWKITLNKLPSYIEYLPDDCKTEDICYYCITQGIQYCRFLKKEDYTQKISNFIINNIDEGTIRYLGKIPNTFITEQHCKYLIKKFSRNKPDIWCYIHDICKNEELCAEYIRYGGEIRYIGVLMISKMIKYLGLGS